MHSDLFDGVFDNLSTGRREIWMDGTLRRYSQRNALNPHSAWSELRAPWGTYPDLPANASRVAA